MPMYIDALYFSIMYINNNNDNLVRVVLIISIFVNDCFSGTITDSTMQFLT